MLLIYLVSGVVFLGLIVFVLCPVIMWPYFYIKNP